MLKDNARGPIVPQTLQDLQSRNLTSSQLAATTDDQRKMLMMITSSFKIYSVEKLHPGRQHLRSPCQRKRSSFHGIDWTVMVVGVSLLLARRPGISAQTVFVTQL